MRKNLLLISALLMLSACGGRPTQTEHADASAAEPTGVEAAQRSYRLSGVIGDDEATMVLERDGDAVKGVVTRCDYCLPIDVEGTWRGGVVKVAGESLAGSHIEYELSVAGKTLQGTELLSGEGEVDRQDVKMTIE